MSDRSEHWNGVYESRDEGALTWFEAEPTLSFELISKLAEPGNPVIDIGGGASRLVDLLVEAGYGPVTILDLSEAGMNVSRRRLGQRAERVTWIVADVTMWEPDHTYALWHDRAVFHFLTVEEDRRAYISTLLAALENGGKAVIMTFAEDGPEMCSGLPVMRYSSERLADALEVIAPGALRPVEERRHVHVTPKGNEQRFQVSVFERVSW